MSEVKDVKCLYRYSDSSYRGSTLLSFFFADEEEMSLLRSIENLYLGEVFGKHSEVYFTLKEDCLYKVGLSEKTRLELMEKMGDSLLFGVDLIGAAKDLLAEMIMQEGIANGV